ncbi:MAG: FG-GAP repeat domain-containing protein [Flavobacterium sp.]
MKNLINKIGIQLLALVIITALYGLTQLPKISEHDKKAFEKEFSFNKQDLFEPTELSPKQIRNVHPQYANISAWISSVGASIAMTDLDNNGFSNDIIHIDPRFDKVLVSSADKTPTTFKPFILEPKSVKYDKTTTAPMGALANDFDKDGQTDILVYYWGRTPIIFYQNNGSFQEKDLCPTQERWFTNAATTADFDGDGHLDILICNYFPDGARVLDAKATDSDQVMQHSMSRAANGGKDHFFLWNNEKKLFEEYLGWDKDIENPTDWTLAVAATHLNDDLLPEIYFANDFGPDKFFLNLSKPKQLKFRMIKGKREIDDIRSGVIGRDSFKGMGVDFGDIDRDGNMDIFVSNIADEFALEESHFAFMNQTSKSDIAKGDFTFKNRSEELGLSRSSWSWDAKFGDFNNDGILEIVQATGFVKGQQNKWGELQELAIGNDELLKKPEVWPQLKEGIDLSGYKHNPFFAKSSSGRYFDIAPLIQIDEKQVTRGIAVGDVDKDGDVDFLVANQWESSALYRNNFKGKSNYLGLTIKNSLASSKEVLIDPTDKPKSIPSIGTSVRVIKDDGKTLIDVVDGGNGHSGKDATDLFFGLEKDKTAKVEIKWRKSDGTIHQKVLNMQSGWHTIYLPY